MPMSAGFVLTYRPYLKLQAPMFGGCSVSFAETERNYQAASRSQKEASS